MRIRFHSESNSESESSRRSPDDRRDACACCCFCLVLLVTNYLVANTRRTPCNPLMSAARPLLSPLSPSLRPQFLFTTRRLSSLVFHVLLCVAIAAEVRLKLQILLQLERSCSCHKIQIRGEARRGEPELSGALDRSIYFKAGTRTFSCLPV